ncbi:hypothetical protein MKZ38_003280 [Zalerion maritima]|uniref:UNC-45/Cro1/She4 central domain-containing protein n=1 Tax=Zalerion maritima TaxID=339359 RepID=A0AAD5RN61_9PEZI|nr:hypothetical protein MKZ38_003280 [Zalerion maritima]
MTTAMATNGNDITPGGSNQNDIAPTMSREDQTLLLFARLMEGGQEADETSKVLDQLTKLLNEDIKAAQAGKKDHKPVTPVIDNDCVDTILGYLDMRQDESVRAHATLATSAYIKAAGEGGYKHLSAFFYARIKRGTYDDNIAAFCVASTLFPLLPEMSAEIFLSEGFLPSLGPLMRRKWKSRKVETACLDMLNAACMVPACREAIQKYCTEWLEEVVDQDPNEMVKDLHSQDPDTHVIEGSISMRRHCEHVKNLAAVILTKLSSGIKAVPPNPSANPPSENSRIQPATTDIEDLTKMFTSMILNGPDGEHQNSIEGLAYATLRPKVKEIVAHDGGLLKKIVKELADAPAKSPVTYGALSVLVNITSYPPTISEEQKKMAQLKAYAQAAGKLPDADPLMDKVHIEARCKAVFEAGVTPVLVTHSKHGSPASLALVVSIISSLSVRQSLCGQLAQQGAIKLLLGSWTALPEKPTSSPHPRTVAAQALARILIKTNPSLIFGGNRSTMTNSIRPLASLLVPASSDGPRDFLPTFEALMALTNLASVDDETRRAICRAAWPAMDDLLLSSIEEVSRASVELICNLVQDPSTIESHFAPSGSGPASGAAKNRLNILLALSDAESIATRSAAGGALASLSGDERVVQGLLQRERGVDAVLKLCQDDSEDLKHRGVFIVGNMVEAEGDTGKMAREMFIHAGALETLKEVAKKSRRQEVMEAAIRALKTLLEQ